LQRFIYFNGQILYMTKQLTNILVFAVVIVLITSCRVERARRYVYATEPANNPFFKKKHDGKIAGYYYGDGKQENDGISVQGAYAITDRLVVAASYSSKKETQTYNYDSFRISYNGFWRGSIETNIYDSSVIKYQRNFYDIAFGYIIPLDKSKMFTYNIYGGLAFGKFSANDNGLDSIGIKYNRYYNANMLKWYLQGAFNFMPIEEFKIAVGGKFTFLNYRNIHTSYQTSELSYFYLDKINGNSLFFLEPYVCVQIGFPKLNWLKIDGQVALSSALPENYPKAKTLSASVGLSVDISKLKKSKH
jgi:hypothetical protein